MSLSIPSFHVSTQGKAKGRASVFIKSRQSVVNSGTFTLSITTPLEFSLPATPYPIGGFSIKADLIDGVVGLYNSTTIDLINVYGKVNPTLFITGRCTGPQLIGGSYWLMLVNNKINDPNGTPDIVGFAIHDAGGNRVCYGTGPVKEGDIEVSASSN
jgi:hypothetical protein